MIKSDTSFEPTTTEHFIFVGALHEVLGRLKNEPQAVQYYPSTSHFWSDYFYIMELEHPFFNYQSHEIENDHVTITFSIHNKVYTYKYDGNDIEFVE